LLIFEPLAPARLGVTERWTVNISRISADIRVVPTNARANRGFARSFSPGQSLMHLSTPGFSYERLPWLRLLSGSDRMLPSSMFHDAALEPSCIQ
jgi:hypothetical protein